MRKVTAFVDDMQAARDFASGDIVRRMGYRELLPGPFAGRVIYSNPNTGKVHVQWPWGAEEEPATELMRDLSGEVAPNMALSDWYSTWEGARLINDKGTVKFDEEWRKNLVASGFKNPDRLIRIVLKHEQRTLPVWRAACKAWYDGLSEFDAFRRVSTLMQNEFGLDVVRLTVSNLYGLANNPSQRFSIYWKDGNRKYKVTRSERNNGSLLCPRCKGLLKPRVYRHQKNCLQCKGCGFTISPKDLVWE
jgi:hypothetical protein